MQFESRKHGFAELIAIGLTFVLGVILIFNVMLPILNTGLTNNPNLNASNLSQCLSNCGSANLTGYTGASGIGTASYIIAVLAILALAAGVVLAFFRGTGGV